MNKVYVIYEIRQEDFIALNNLEVDFDCVKIFKNESVAMNWFLDTLKEQCSLIELEENGKSIYGLDDEEGHKWVAKVYDKNKIYKEKSIKVADVYYCDEWQYSMYLKEMVVE